MAVAVDSFELMLRHLSSTFSSFRDGLAMVGIAFSLKKAIQVTCSAVKMINVHGVPQIFHPNLLAKYGPWAVVTGSTHGIGKAYAQQLASLGFNIIVISIVEHDCSEVAKNLESQFNIQTEIIPVDLNSGDKVYDQIRRGLNGKNIGLLVNNVGVMYEYPQYFVEVPTEKLWQIINVNIAATTMLTHMILPKMLERNSGAVVTLSSISHIFPTPLMTVYSASQTYLDFFMKGIAFEYRNSNIFFQTLSPSFVATKMVDFSSELSSPGFFIPSATNYVRSAIGTLGRSSNTTGYLPHQFQCWLIKMMGERVYQYLSLVTNLGFRTAYFRRRESHKQN